YEPGREALEILQQSGMAATGSPRLPRHFRWALYLLVLLILAALVLPRVVHPQSPTILVRVHVVDSARAPVAAAELTIVRGLKDVMARGQTNDAGDAVLRVKRAESDHQLIVRRIGYSRTERF